MAVKNNILLSRAFCGEPIEWQKRGPRICYSFTMNLSILPKKYASFGKPSFVETAELVDMEHRGEHTSEHGTQPRKLCRPPVFWTTLSAYEQFEMSPSSFFSDARKQLRCCPVGSFRFCFSRFSDPSLACTLPKLHCVVTTRCQKAFLADWGCRNFQYNCFRHLDAPMSMWTSKPCQTFALPHGVHAMFVGFTAVQLSDGWWVVIHQTGHFFLRQHRFANAAQAVAQAVMCAQECSVDGGNNSYIRSRSDRRAFWNFEREFEIAAKDCIGAYSSSDQDSGSESEEEVIEVLDSGVITTNDRVLLSTRAMSTVEEREAEDLPMALHSTYEKINGVDDGSDDPDENNSPDNGSDCEEDSGDDSGESSDGSDDSFSDEESSESDEDEDEDDGGEEELTAIPEAVDEEEQVAPAPSKVIAADTTATRKRKRAEQSLSKENAAAKKQAIEEAGEFLKQKLQAIQQQQLEQKRKQIQLRQEESRLQKHEKRQPAKKHSDAKTHKAKRKTKRDKSTNLKLVSQRSKASVPKKLPQDTQFDSLLVDKSASQLDRMVDKRLQQMSTSMDQWRSAIESTLLTWQTSTVESVNQRLTAIEARLNPLIAQVPTAVEGDGAAGADKKGKTRKKKPQPPSAATAKTAEERPKRPLTAKQQAMRAMNAKYGIGNIPKDSSEWKAYCETYGEPKKRPKKQLEAMVKKYNGRIPPDAPDFVKYCALHGVPTDIPSLNDKGSSSQPSADTKPNESNAT